MRLSKLLIPLAFALALSSCLTGPAGKDGAAGSPGQNGSSVVLSSLTGILYPSEEKKDSGFTPYWNISNSSITDDRLISVFVRQGAGYMWKEPTWFLSTGYVRVVDDEKADPSWEYRITIGR